MPSSNRDSSMHEEAIEIRGLKKAYEDTEALRGISLEVNSGEMFGMIGPDGAGKTTAMRILCGLLDMDEGECTIMGKDVKTEVRQVRSIIGYMPQRFSLYPDLTVSENLRFFADLFQVPREERDKKLKQLLDFSALEPFQKRRAAQLSGGMKQKLALSCTLIHTPEVLILDEPTTGVDPVSRQEFWNILSELKQGGVTILVSTPYMEEAELCDHVALIHKGEILALNVPKEIPKLFPHEILELRGMALERAARVLEGRPEIMELQLFGDTIHLSVKNAEEYQARVKQILDHAGMQEVTVEIAEPGLEDAFVALMKR
jgi:ABC-2 type transport system ATP-binding protein